MHRLKLLLGSSAVAAATGYVTITKRKRKDNYVLGVSAEEQKPSSRKDQPLPTRQDQLRSLQETPEFDILIIGGGATGCGVALDAVTRGLKTALVEKDDFASGSSCKSTKAIGGVPFHLQKAIKNVDYTQYKLFKDVLHERSNLLTVAPHLAKPVAYMIPLHRWWEVPYYYFGTKMGDFLSGKDLIQSSYYLSKTKALEKFSKLRDNISGAVVYYEAQHNDARMNLTIGLTAVQNGGVLANHSEVVSLLKKTDMDGTERVCGAKIKDCITGEEFDVRAKAVINATGPETDKIRLMGDPKTLQMCKPNSGIHIVLPKSYSPDSMGLLDPAADGRIIFFIPWMGQTLVGTTMSPCEVTHKPAPSIKEIDSLLDAVRNYLNDTVVVRREDVQAVWSGIRPMVTDPKAKDQKTICSSHVVDVTKNKLFTIVGGKWTTYRLMAVDVVNAVVKACSQLNPERGSQTDGLILEGGHNWSPNYSAQLTEKYGLDPLVAEHLSNTYGDRADEVARVAEKTGKQSPAVGKRLAEDFPFIEAEVHYAIGQYACTLVDVIARRTRLAFLSVEATEEALPKIADIMAKELKWSHAKKERELSLAKEFLNVEMGGQYKDGQTE